MSGQAKEKKRHKRVKNLNSRHSLYLSLCAKPFLSFRLLLVTNSIMKTPFEVQLRDVHTTLDEFSLFRIPLHCMLEPIFVWTWNESARTKQKQQTNGNRAISLVYRTDKHARGFWLVKRTFGWKNFMPENFLEINRYFSLTSYCNTIGQSNNAFSILGFSLAGKRRVHVLTFSSIGW